MVNNRAVFIHGYRAGGVLMIISVAMPEHDARETARTLGPQYTAVGIQVDDADGYVDVAATALNWFVEYDGTTAPDRIFGYSWAEIQAMQKGE